ncbi:MAG TPA: hypothetical protein PKJ08_09830, partial [Candidatus Cloacimonadota bacterium]|nr:hypothetical protein [Candidatus Cloacimonadota bacterium]
NEKMKQDTGDYAFDISMLNMNDEIKDSFFEFTLNDTAIVAISKNLSVKEVSYYYMVADQKFKIAPDSKKIIDETIFDRIKK